VTAAIAGIGRSIELLHHITEQQLHEAQQSNPLTLLPGNREIDSEVFRLLALRAQSAICHADIDHFKPFNDEYGYSRGDQVLLHLAGLCRSAAVEGLDFVGHPGGDDFILIMRSQDWQHRITRIVENFSASCARFYSDAHRTAGGFKGHDREGSERMFPLMTLSVGVAVADGTRLASAAELMQVLASAKQTAKSRRGNAVVVHDGGDDQGIRLRGIAQAG
jgi:diguanylate cyclase (GGDEF)-like protein